MLTYNQLGNLQSSKCLFFCNIAFDSLFYFQMLASPVIVGVMLLVISILSMHLRFDIIRVSSCIFKLSSLFIIWGYLALMNLFLSIAQVIWLEFGLVLGPVCERPSSIRVILPLLLLALAQVGLELPSQLPGLRSHFLVFEITFEVILELFVLVFILRMNVVDVQAVAG